MKKLDEACAWLIFLTGILHVVFLEIFRWRGGDLDTGLMYIFLAMFNLLRVRSRETMRLLMVFCLGANASALIFEVARWNLWGRSLYVGLTAGSLGVLVLILLQTIGSVADVVRRWKLRKSAASELPQVPDAKG
jgi:hypothetical protein